MCSSRTPAQGDGSPGGQRRGSLCLCRTQFLVHLLPSPEKGVRAAVQSPAWCLRVVFQPQLLAACPVPSRACFAFCRAVARPQWRQLGIYVPWHACFHAPKKSRYCNLCFPFPPSWFIYAPEMHVHILLPPPLSLGCRCKTALSVCRTLLKAPPHHTPWGFSVPWAHNLRVSTCISDLGSDCSVLTAASTISSARAGQPPCSKHQPTHSTSHTLRQRLPPSGSHFKQILQLHVFVCFFFFFPFLFAQQVLGAESASLPCQALQISAVSRSQDAHAPPLASRAPPHPPGEQGPGVSRAQGFPCRAGRAPLSVPDSAREVSDCKIHKENLPTSLPPKKTLIPQ